ncbi:hypothetical protein HYW55_00610 [Candidatus Gottesmanbacteria bacterium]|nr:hypothetical protein [Candidatus Gottesmanbacteria bacterium]
MIEQLDRPPIEYLPLTPIVINNQQGNLHQDVLPFVQYFLELYNRGRRLQGKERALFPGVISRVEIQLGQASIAQTEPPYIFAIGASGTTGSAGGHKREFANIIGWDGQRAQATSAKTVRVNFTHQQNIRQQEGAIIELATWENILDRIIQATDEEIWRRHLQATKGTLLSVPYAEIMAQDNELKLTREWLENNWNLLPDFIGTGRTSAGFSEYFISAAAFRNAPAVVVYIP